MNSGSPAGGGILSVIAIVYRDAIRDDQILLYSSDLIVEALGELFHALQSRPFLIGEPCSGPRGLAAEPADLLHLWAKRAEAPILGTVYMCFEGF